MNIRLLDLYKQYLSIQTEIDEAIHSIITQSAFIGGNAVHEFEKAFGDYQQAKYCVGVGNGTDALEIAIEALALPDGSEIIVPANSFIASAEAVTRCGHRVVFADIELTSYTLDLVDVERRIGPNTRAVIAVHLYGHPCEMKGLLNLGRKYDLRIIEDCAQAHGADYNGQRIGALGDIGAFSFYPGKNLGAYGDAGALTTNNHELAARCRMIANHGRIEKYNHLIEGRNSRLDGLQAAILGVKLRYLDTWISRRKEIAQRYLSGLHAISGIVLPIVGVGVGHAFHQFVLRTSQRDALKEYLAGCGIETGIHYPIALPKLQAYKRLAQSSEAFRANIIDGEVLSIPIGEHLSDCDVDSVVSAVRSYFS